MTEPTTTDRDSVGAEAELAHLAERIKTCVKKSDNYAVTAGQHLREARARCRAIGLDFNKWCAEANLGIKRRRIYQLMGPDPIAAERREANHRDEPENVQSLHIEQSESGELPSEPLPEPPALRAPKPANVNVGPIMAAQFSLRDLPFDAASSMVQAWFGTLTDELKVEHATKIVGAMTREQIDEVMSGLGGDCTPVERTAAKHPVAQTEQDQVELAMGEAEPAQPEEVGDRVNRLVARFNALSESHAKWCRDHLDNPEDAINSVKNNQTWADVRDVLTGLVALSAAEQDAFRAQVGVTPVAAELEQAA